MNPALRHRHHIPLFHWWRSFFPFFLARMLPAHILLPKRLMPLCGSSIKHNNLRTVGASCTFTLKLFLVLRRSVAQKCVPIYLINFYDCSSRCRLQRFRFNLCARMWDEKRICNRSDLHRSMPFIESIFHGLIISESLFFQSNNPSSRTTGVCWTVTRKKQRNQSPHNSSRSPKRAAYERIRLHPM